MTDHDPRPAPTRRRTTPRRHRRRRGRRRPRAGDAARRRARARPASATTTRTCRRWPQNSGWCCPTSPASAAATGRPRRTWMTRSITEITVDALFQALDCARHRRASTCSATASAAPPRIAMATAAPDRVTGLVLMAPGGGWLPFGPTPDRGPEGDVPLLQRRRARRRRRWRAFIRTMVFDHKQFGEDVVTRPLRGLARREPHRVLPPLQRRVRQAPRHGPAVARPAQDHGADPAAVGPRRPHHHPRRRADHAQADPRRPAARLRPLRALGAAGAAAPSSSAWSPTSSRSIA